MKVVGVNAGGTRARKPLRDGALALIDDGVVSLAISNERITRVKSDGGSDAVATESEARGLLPADAATRFYWSSCCESKGNTQFAVSHHLSHALMAYHWSHFEEAVVIVADDGGDTLSEGNGDDIWWTKSREQLSVFVFQGGNWRLVGRDFDGPGEVGLGEIYRAFTYHLGWRSGRHAGNTMALSGIGNSNITGNHIFRIINGRCRSPVNDFNPFDTESTVRSCMASIGLSCAPPRLPGAAITEQHVEMARIVQGSLEFILLEKVNSIVRSTGISNVVLAGGVALNCRAIQTLVEESHARQIFVPPAANDHGQALGNALYATHIHGIALKYPLGMPYYGFSHSLDVREIRRLASKVDAGWCVQDMDTIALIDFVAEIMRTGGVVGWFQGRSEYGPRALGNRSILAAPFSRRTADSLNSLKGREWFMPFAASICAEYASQLLESAQHSPFMSRTFAVKQALRAEVPAITHVDGTCRAQVLKKEDNEIFWRLIEAFRRRTGIPALLNTSLNGPGEPIVETPLDALKLFQKASVLNVLVLGNIVVSRSRQRSRCWGVDNG